MCGVALLSAGLVWAGGDLSRQRALSLKVLVGAADSEFTKLLDDYLALQTNQVTQMPNR